MILEPGSFRVSDYRRPITAAAERAVRKRYELDHRPALTDRPYDTEAGDFIPPQNDPEHIDLIEARDHDERTFGRKADAAKTTTTRGSDVGERARTRDIRTSEAIHRAALASRDGDYRGAAQILANAPKQSRLKPKRKIESRGFGDGHRPMQSRNDFRRNQRRQQRGERQ